MEALKLVKREEKVSLTAAQQRIIDGYKVITDDEMEILRQKEEALKKDCAARKNHHNEYGMGFRAKYVWVRIGFSTHNS